MKMIYPIGIKEMFKNKSLTEISNEVHQFNYDNGFYERFDEDGFEDNQRLKIIAELGEMFDARRKENYAGDRVDIKHVVNNGIGIDTFTELVKDSFEDELADLFIYSLDWIGSPINHLEEEFPMYKESSFDLTYSFHKENDFDLYKEIMTFIRTNQYDYPYRIIGFVESIAECYNINLEYHVYAKLAYNMTRGKRHGKSS